MPVQTKNRSAACGVASVLDKTRPARLASVSGALQTLAPATPAYCNTDTMGQRQMNEVLISKITTCQLHKNITEERRNLFQWRFSLARWGFLRERPSAPVSAPWKWSFGTFVKVSKFLQRKQCTQHTEDCVSGAAFWFGLVLQRSSTLAAAEGQHALPTRRHYTWCLCQLTIRGRNHQDLGSGPATRPRWRDTDSTVPSLCPLLPASLGDHWQNQRKIVALLLSNHRKGRAQSEKRDLDKVFVFINLIKGLPCPSS